MAKPIVAVIGRPNVGKSTMVNRLSRKQSAIVHESRGVTRDRSYHESDWNGREFVLVDTGGIESEKSDDIFATRIREQAFAACDQADVILFVVDGVVGATEEDEEVARILRKSNKPVFLLVNKVDDPSREDMLWEFYSLGIGEPWSVSALHGHGTGDLLDAIVEALPEDTQQEDIYPDDAINIAIIGRPNVGKSSLINKITGTERSIVSDIAGTTRDAVDIVVEHDDEIFRLVDTAGMRKKNLVHEDIEYYSYVRGIRAIDDAEVCLLVIDAVDGVTEQDQKIAQTAIEKGCALIVLLNKWDLMKNDEHAREVCMMSVERRLEFAKWAPILRISALSGRSVDKIWELVARVRSNHSARVSTARLNDVLQDIRDVGHTVVVGKRRLKIMYGTEVAVKPPTFAFFCNYADLVDNNFKHFIENRLRAEFDLEGTPIRMHFKRKE